VIQGVDALESRENSFKVFCV